MEKPEIRQSQISDRDKIAAMYEQLWPETPIEEHASEIESILHSGMSGILPAAILVAHDGANELTGFLQVGLRSHADGCDTTQPVGFVEGWFVHKPFRNQGIGRQLLHFAEEWARKQGCKEMASDTWIDQTQSQKAHEALGFEIVDRCIHFRKHL